MPNRLNISRLSILLLGCFTIVGCGSGGNDSSNSGSNNTSGDVSSLQIITPMTIFSKPAESSLSYIVIKNPTAAAVSNLHYSLANLIGGAKGAEIESASVANCAVVESMSQCNLKVTIPAGAVAGSLGFSANNENSNLSDKLNKSLKAGSSESQTIGVEQIAYNSKSGADGITLSYYHTVINGTPYILVTGLVASANAGSFNNIVLVDDNGNVLPNQEIIGNLNNAQGSTFSMLVQLPSANGTSITVKIQTQQNGKAVSTSTQGYTLSLTEGVGIANTLPEAVYLTSTNPEQIVTFSNTGDSVAQLKQLLASNPNIEVIFTPVSLESGAITTATLRLKNTSISTVNGTMTLSYNNGQNETANTTIVDQNVLPAPTPSPAPTPTPGPGPSPTVLEITITPIANWQTMMGSAYAFTATITGGSSTVTPSVTGLTGNTVSPASCDLDSAAIASCVFIVTDYTSSGNYSFWDPRIDNSDDVANPAIAYSYSGISLQVTATNSATINGSVSPLAFGSIAGTVIIPYVYLAAPVPGAASATNTGITWGSGGTISTRFVNGKRNDDTTCTDSRKDNLTGLEWAKNTIIGFTATDGGSPILQPDYINIDPELNRISYSDAVTAINNMNNATNKLCGQSDWRIPTINELRSMINYAAAQNGDTPAIWLNSQGFNNMPEGIGSIYWSATNYAADKYLNASFADANTSTADDTATSQLVWPVRGGQ